MITGNGPVVVVVMSPVHESAMCSGSGVVSCCNALWNMARESGGFVADGAVVGLSGDGGYHGDQDGRCLLSGALPVCEGHAASGGAH